MSLFKRIFGNGEEKKETAEPLRTVTARSVRVRLTALHRVSFLPQTLNTGPSQLGVGNISTGGMAVMHLGNDLGKLGQDVAGYLHVDQERFEIAARIRHLNAAIAGCEFVGDNIPLRRAIESYLRVEILALQLRRVHDAYLKHDPRGPTYWFTDGRQNEVFCVVDSEGQLVTFHMSFLGCYVEWQKESRVRTGRVRSESTGDRSEDPGHKGASLLDMSGEPEGHTSELAKIFVQNVDRFPDEVRQQILKELGEVG